MSSTKLATRNPGVIAVSPSARRLMTSMRDIGYNPSTAIADLVDSLADSVDPEQTEKAFLWLLEVLT